MRKGIKSNEPNFVGCFTSIRYDGIQIQNESRQSITIAHTHTHAVEEEEKNDNNFSNILMYHRLFLIGDVKSVYLTKYAFRNE